MKFVIELDPNQLNLIGTALLQVPQDRIVLFNQLREQAQVQEAQLKQDTLRGASQATNTLQAVGSAGGETDDMEEAWAQMAEISRKGKAA